MNTVRSDIRNIAIIAHVDHGKTTLVDQMLRQAGTFRDNQTVAERVMDSNDIERERGITILAKNTAIHYQGTKINIVDTPGHADFGGEVERVLKMVQGVILLVDAFEGAMPQTRFVLRKALELGHRVLVVVNKIDRSDARPEEVIDEILSLMIDLHADDTQLDCPFLFASGRDGTCSLEWQDPGTSLTPLFDAILKYVPAPAVDPEGPLQALISTIDFSEYVGRIGIGRIERGTARKNMIVTRVTHGHADVFPSTRLVALYTFDGLERVAVDEVAAGDIVAFVGSEDISIGQTVVDPAVPEALPFVKISEPTVRMTFQVNDSPYAGKEGKYVTSRHLRARLERELLTDVSLRMFDTESTDAFEICGRGELHLSILIENMRRQEYEFAVSKPEVLYQEIDGVKCEPMEIVLVDVPAEYSGNVIQELGRRKGVLQSMHGEGRVRLEFRIPARGLFGYRSDFLTDTRGEGIMNTIFDGYEPYHGEIERRPVGSLVAFETGVATQYGLFYAQERGSLFITAGMPVYAGMIVGRNARAGDIEVNVCRTKHLTNMRSSSADDSLRLKPITPPTLEESLEFLEDDELCEITPQSIRLRKRVLDATQRMRINARKKDA